MTTVSLVVNERPGTGLRPETQERVRLAIRELGYRPNPHARSLVFQSSKTIGFVGERLGTPFSGGIISGAHDSARAAENLLLILDAEDDEEIAGCIDELQNHRVDGIIVATEGTRLVRLPRQIHRLPTVLVNCVVQGDWVPSIVPDEEQGGRAAARLLLQAGHRDVCYLAGDPAAWATRRRVKGFRAAFAEAGISARRVPVRYGDYRSASGYTLCRQIMESARRPTAIFCGNDRMAFGAYAALSELGLAIPDDVSVVGYDDQEELADSLHPGLTTLHLPFYEMGVLAVKHLLAGTSDALPRESLIPCPPVVRDSVKAITDVPQHPQPARRRSSPRASDR